ncbi:Uncharacterised protein [Mycobacterium tuberculosis]|nr:Uncharacterised protein [Mycobacterium tuberculosis]
MAYWFPSPLGVLGLTTSDSISPGGQQISQVSVPSRGFGSDDVQEFRVAVQHGFRFPSPLGVLGLTTRKSTRAGVERCPVSVPSRGFGSDDMRIRCQHMGFRVFPSPLGVLGLTT